MVDTKPRHYMTGILIFVLLIGAGIALIDLGQDENSGFIEPTLYSDFNDSFNKREEALEATNDLEEDVLDLGLPEPLEFLSVLFVRGYKVLTSLFSSLEFMEDIVTSVGRIFNVFIPTWVADVIIAIISSMLIFSIVSAILQRDI